MAVRAGRSGILFPAVAREFVSFVMCRVSLRTPLASHSINTTASYP